LFRNIFIEDDIILYEIKIQYFVNAIYEIISYPNIIQIAPEGKIIHMGSTDKIPEMDEKQKRAFM